MLMNLKDCTLGETRTLHHCDTSADNLEALVALASQTRQTVDIYSRLLDPNLYGNTEFVDEIRRICLGIRFAKIRIIVTEIRTIMLESNALVELAFRLNSFIHMRHGPESCHNNDEEYVVFDKTAWLRRETDFRFDSKLTFSDRYSCRKLLKKFDEYWEESTPDVNLRKLNL